MRKIIFIIFSLAVIYVGVGCLLPDSVHVKRSVKIAAPAEEVYRHVADLRRWNSWSDLLPDEGSMSLQFIQDETRKDIGYSWNTGGFTPQKRRLLITGDAWCDSISAKMSFAEDGIASSCFRFNEEAGKTKVEWDFKIDLGKGISARWRGPFIHHLISPDLNLGLHKLKAISEENAAIHMNDLAADHPQQQTTD
jgi:hypothetical protein